MDPLFTTNTYNSDGDRVALPSNGGKKNGRIYDNDFWGKYFNAAINPLAIHYKVVPALGRARSWLISIRYTFPSLLAPNILATGS